MGAILVAVLEPLYYTAPMSIGRSRNSDRSSHEQSVLQTVDQMPVDPPYTDRGLLLRYLNKDDTFRDPVAFGICHLYVLMVVA